MAALLAPPAGLNAAIAFAQRLACDVDTVSLAMAAGRLRRYSEPNPFGTSLTSAFQPAAGVYVCPALMRNPLFVITRSLAWAVAAAVETVVVVVATACVEVPIWSSGATAATPLHSVIWTLPLTFAGTVVNVCALIPPGLLG